MGAQDIPLILAVEPGSWWGGGVSIRGPRAQDGLRNGLQGDSGKVKVY